MLRLSTTRADAAHCCANPVTGFILCATKLKIKFCCLPVGIADSDANVDADRSVASWRSLNYSK